MANKQFNQERDGTPLTNKKSKDKLKDETKAHRTKLRKKKRTPGKLSDGEKFQVIKMWVENAKYMDIANEFCMDYHTTNEWLRKFVNSVLAMHETRQLMKGGKVSNASLSLDAPVSTSKAIDKDFNALLSDESIDILNDAENIYVSTIIATGNTRKALALSGFDVNIDYASKAHGWLCRARGAYLNSRPKISAAIKKEEDLMIASSTSSKEYLQKTLIQQINEMQEQVSENPQSRSQLLKSLELLGKTIPSAFTETVRTEEVSAKSTLQLLMKKVEAKKQLTEDIDEVEMGTYHVE